MIGLAQGTVKIVPFQTTWKDLRENPTAFEEYKNLKLELAAQFADRRENYT